MIYYKSNESDVYSPVNFIELPYLSDGFLGYEQNMTVQEISNMQDCSSFTVTASISTEQFIMILSRSFQNNWRKMRHIPKHRTWNIKRYKRRI